MKLKYLVILILIFILWACTKDKMPVQVELDNQLRQNIIGASPEENLEYYILPETGDLANIPQDPKNPLTPKKVDLGKMLFYDTGLGRDAVKSSGIGTYSCSSCHIPEAGFKPGNFQGIADGGIGFGVNGEKRLRNTDYQESDLDVQSARPLTMVNVAFVKNTFWNGQFGSGGVNVGTEHLWDDDEATARNHLGFEAIETQNFDGIRTHRITINKEILDEYGYTEIFDEVFPEYSPDERYTQDVASLAISAFIRSIVSDQAPFQKWLKGEKYALSKEEKKGAILFFGKAQCYQCHYKQNLGSEEFHTLGVLDMDQSRSFNAFPDDKRNLGRGGFTLKEEDNYKFKVPGLYNVGDTDFYFHGASHTSIESVLRYKFAASPENPRVSPDRMSVDLKKLTLTDEEIYDLIAFLENGLKDPNLTRFAPASVLSGLCFPNNDPQSKIDLGCE